MRTQYWGVDTLAGGPESEVEDLARPDVSVGVLAVPNGHVRSASMGFGRDGGLRVQAACMGIMMAGSGSSIVLRMGQICLRDIYMDW